MGKAKRGGGHLNRRVCKSRRASRNESSVSGCALGDYCQGVRSGPSDWPVSCWSKSVASITLYNGDAILFSCSGIAVERQGCHLTRFLTSASLARAVNGTNEDHDDLKIEVRHEGNEVYVGVMAEFDLDCNFAVVSVHADIDAQVRSFQHPPQLLPFCGEVLVAIGRSVFGEIIAKKVELDGDSRVSEDEYLDCKISEAWEGGPLVSADGKIVGMNLSLTTRRVLFLPWGTILKHLQRFWKKTRLARSKTSHVYRFAARPIGEKYNSHPEVHGDFLNREQLDLHRRGYPELPSSMLVDGMVLVNTFEETFGDINGEGIWRKFSRRASSNLNRNVVALASFNGEKRFFACTGFFIEWNGSPVILTSASLVRNSGDEEEIVKDLKIEVFVNSQYREGTLKHWSPRYNVALVSVKDYHAFRTSNTLLRWDKAFEVAAIGRIFESGELMATSGQLVAWTGTLDCTFLSTSTCKITKAGIGGPVVNLDGDVIGMNFYDERIGTPFLRLEAICNILASFDTKSDLPGVSFWKMDEDDKTVFNRWPVPMPCWCNPADVVQDKPDEFDPESGCALYGYYKGEKVTLF